MTHSDDARHSAGMKVRREVLGDEHVDRAVAGTHPDNADFQDYITRVAWGDIWSRPGLDRRARSIVVLSVLMTAGYWEEVPMHFRAAITNGLTREEIREVILQVGLYRGVPVANHGTALLRETLGEAD
ncbi:MAG: carboxymuconolactone decarboxylase family protein [Pseudolysinimonas sp.]|uniref:carboxymuconolactone decarboxylase family protein n=1 Tax=Pseudolysinimonas sp. TaxID=2680009 RepID=UPI0032674EA8